MVSLLVSVEQYPHQGLWLGIAMCGRASNEKVGNPRLRCPNEWMGSWIVSPVETGGVPHL